MTRFDVMVGIRDSRGRFWSVLGLKMEEAMNTARMWCALGIECRAVVLSRREALAVLADLEADE